MTDAISLQSPNATARESSPQAYQRLLPIIRAVDPARARQVNLDPMILVPLVLAKLPKLRTLRADLSAMIKDFEVEKFDELDDMARALQHAHGLYEEATQPADGFKEAIASAEQLREILQADAVALVKRGQLHPDSIKDVKRNNGHRALILDLQVLCAALRNAGAAAQARVSEQELARAVELIDTLTESLGVRELPAESVSEVALIRRQAFTLFMETYEDNVRPGVMYLRRKFGDADEYAPSPYTNQQRSTATRRPEPTAQPAPTPQPEPHSSPVSTVQPLDTGAPSTSSPVQDISAAVASKGPFRRS